MYYIPHWCMVGVLEVNQKIIMKGIKVLNKIYDPFNKSIYLFTLNPKKDINIFIKEYENEDGNSRVNLGFETPELSKYMFLGVEYECVSLWFDNEDLPEKLCQ